MKKTAILLMIITIISKIFGFIRDVSLSYFYGATNISDAYLISITIPMVIFSFIGIGIVSGYIPMYSKIEKTDGVNEGNKYTNNLINILLVICTIIVIFGFLFTKQIVMVFALGFKEDTLALAVQFTRISILGIYFIGFIHIFNGYLQLKGNYIIPALTGFPLNFFIIISIFLSTKTNILILSIGSVIAVLSQLFLILPFVHKKGYRYKLILNINDKYVKNMACIALPIIISISVNQINVLVDKTIASQITTGGISALNYANRLNEFVQSIFVLSITTVLYPMISKMAAENNMSGFKKSISKAISSISLLVIPATVGAMIFPQSIVRLLFGRGAFDSQDIYMTSYALFFYSIGMIGFGLREVLSRAFYSIQDTKTPMVNAVIAMVMNIVLNIILSKYLGIGGLALATSISAILCTLLLFISLRKKIGSFGMKNLTILFIKVLCTSLVMGIIAKVSYNVLFKNMNANLSLIISIGIGAVTYFAIIYFMKIEEVDVIVYEVKTKINKIVS